jgi:hypothetical protein
MIPPGSHHGGWEVQEISKRIHDHPFLKKPLSAVVLVNDPRDVLFLGPVAL